MSSALRQVAPALANVALGANLTSLALLRTPGRFVDYVSETVFLSRSFGRARGFPEKNVWEVIPRSSGHVANVRLGNLVADGTWFYMSSYAVDLVNLMILCDLIRPRVVFEIGTLNGYTAYHFALNSGDETRVYTLDLPKDSVARPALAVNRSDVGFIETRHQRPDYCFAGTAVASKIVTLLGDSATFDYSPYRGIVDLFFIDGAHSFDYVQSDTGNALEACHSGSVIAWHDLGRTGTGVERYLRERARTMPVYVVPGGSLAYAIVP